MTGFCTKPGNVLPLNTSRAIQHSERGGGPLNILREEQTLKLTDKNLTLSKK
jgi:hypothetical protein